MNDLTDIFGSEPPPSVAAPISIVNGIHGNISNADYHAHSAISNSYLSRLDKCPAAAKVAQETTEAMRIGTATHCYILEGEEIFFSRYAIAPVCDRRTKEGKQIYADFCAASEGKEVVSAADLDRIMCMSESVHLHPFAAKLLESGKAETSIFWTDMPTGLQMKCRLDWLPEVGEVVVDLKTTDNAGESAFLGSIKKYGYHRQAAIYLDGAQAAGLAVDTFAFIAVEKSAPYRVEVYTLCPDFIQAGRDDYRRILDIEMKCRTAKQYPHYTNPGVTEIVKPLYL